MWMAWTDKNSDELVLIGVSETVKKPIFVDCTQGSLV